MNEEDARNLVSELYGSHYGVLVRYAGRLLGSVPMAEDIVQQSFLDLYTALRKDQRIDNPRAWTFAVVRNAIRKEIRLHSRTTAEPMEVIEALAGVEPGPEARGLENDEVHRLLSVLSEREEEALLLRLSVMSYAEIADELQISPKTVSVLLTRGLKKLRKAFGRPAPSETREAPDATQPRKPLQ